MYVSVRGPRQFNSASQEKKKKAEGGWALATLLVLSGKSLDECITSGSGWDILYVVLKNSYFLGSAHQAT